MTQTERLWSRKYLCYFIVDHLLLTQVHLWHAEEQTPHLGHPPTTVPEGSRSDCGPQRGLCIQVILCPQPLKVIFQRFVRGC